MAFHFYVQRMQLGLVAGQDLVSSADASVSSSQGEIRACDHECGAGGFKDKLVSTASTYITQSRNAIENSPAVKLVRAEASLIWRLVIDWHRSAAPFQKQKQQ